MTALAPRINIAPPRRKGSSRGFPWYVTLALMPFIIPVKLAIYTACAVEALNTLWSDLYRESWMAWRAWRELGALDRFLTLHGGASLNRAAANQWAWVDDDVRWELRWHPSDDRAYPSTLELRATLPYDLMTVKLRSDKDEAPVLLSDPCDTQRLQDWAQQVAERIVREIFAQIKTLPMMTAGARTAQVLVPMTMPLKPLIGALELLLTAVPRARA